MKKFDVVCFGSAVVDAFVKIPLKEEKGKLCIPGGCKMLMEDLYFEIGGGGTNTAVAFSRLGFKTGYIGKLGKDGNGIQISELLKKERIDFLGKKVNESTSGFSVVLTGGGRNRSILTHKGINNEITPRDLKKFKTKWLYLSSLMGKSLKTQIELVKEARKKGVKIAFNPSEYLIRRNLLEVKKLVRDVDVLILNDMEASLLVNKKDKVKVISNMGPKIVVITNEEKTIVCYDGDKIYRVKPPKVNVLEKTGAGDAFAAGFVSGMILNKPIDYCIKLGVKESQSVLKHLGAKNNLIREKLK